MDRSPDPMATRRAVLTSLGVAAGLAAFGGPPVDVKARPTAPLQPDRESYSTEEVTIESFDGAKLATTLYEPDATGPHPAILMTHGWGGNRGDLGELAASYASQEYVVLAYDSRGFGDSGGAVHSTGPEEQKDASTLISWLAGLESVLTDGEENPRIGMDGVSYGGGIQLRTAAFDDRLDAIVPRSTWYDNAQALAPDDVLKVGWLVLLTVGARNATISSDIEGRSESILTSGEMQPDDREYYAANSPVSYPDDIDTPALVIHEWSDRLFTVNQAVENYRWLQENDTETALIVGEGDTHYVGETPPGSEASEAFASEAAMTWLDAHLKGDGDHGIEPVSYYDHDSGEFVTATEFPPESERTTTHSLDSSLELDGDDIARLDIPIDEKTEVVGIPSLELEVSPTGEGRSYLMVALQHVADDVTTVHEQVTPVAISETDTIDIDLAAVQRVFEPGDQLRIALARRDDLLTSVDFVPIGSVLSDIDLPDEFNGTLFVDSNDGAGIEIGGPVTVSVPATAPLGDIAVDTIGPSTNSEEPADDSEEPADDSADDSGGGFGVPATLSGLSGLAYFLSKCGESE